MQKNKLYHILSYIPVLFIISMLIPEKNNRLVRFHCGQGMVLTIASVVSGILGSIVGFVIGWIPFVGPIVTWIVSTVLGLAILVLVIIGIVNAANDKEAPLPIIGKYAFYK